MTDQSFCRATHRQIRLGRCPWCDITMLEGQPAPEKSAATFDNLWWDVATMMGDLKDGDEQTRLETVSSLVKHPPGVDDALRLIRVAECDPLDGVRDLTRKALCQLADTISIEAAGRYEAKFRDHAQSLVRPSPNLIAFAMPARPSISTPASGAAMMTAGSRAVTSMTPATISAPRAESQNMSTGNSIGKRLSVDDAAVLLVDHQAGLLSLVQDYSPDEFHNNVLALADIARLFKLPTILTTSFESGPNGLLMPELKERFPQAPYIPPGSNQRLGQ